MKYQSETIVDVIEEMVILNRLHYKEIAGHKHLKKLDPNYEQYQELEDSGNLRIFTVRDNSNLVGYFITFIQPHIHYSNCVFALNDILFIHKDYRGGTVGYRLFKEAIQDLRDNTNASILCIHMKVQYPFRKLLGKLGFSLSEENWEVEL